MFGFFGELNPLSNFHPAPFIYNSTNYHSTEQLIQHQKVRQFGGKETAEEIINSKDALNCKCLSKEISNYNHDTWKKEVKSRCEEGIKAKFFQNSELWDHLISTGWRNLENAVVTDFGGMVYHCMMKIVQSNLSGVNKDYWVKSL